MADRADIFIKLDTIEGESLDQKHQKEIEVQTVSWGLTNAGSFAHSAGGGTGKSQVQDVHFTKFADKSSPKLAKACATGQHIPKGIITFRKAGVKEGQIEYFKYTLSDLLVSSYHFSDASGSKQLPHESVSLNFSKIEIEYKEQKADGSAGPVTQASWDIKKAVAT